MTAREGAVGTETAAAEERAGAARPARPTGDAPTSGPAGKTRRGTGSADRTGGLLRLLGVPVGRGDWRELAFALLLAPLAVLGTALTYPVLVLALPLSVTHLGLPLLAGVLTVGRRLAGVHRFLLRALLGEDIPAPPPVERGRTGAVRAALTDGTGWRAVAHLLAALPLGLLLLAVAVGLRLYGLAGVLYPLWWRSVSADGHRGLSLGSLALDTWPRILAVALAGFLVTALAGWSGRRLLVLVRYAGRALLGPSRLSDRVRDLEETRALAVQDSARTLRRIERDLHDGPQAQLTAVTMSLASARGRLTPSGPDGAVAPQDLERGRELVEHALDTARTAVTQLRDLVRGIHPPVLDTGLDAALETLAARTGVPVRLRAHVPGPLPEAVATIAYFCASELLSNAARHSGAERIELTAERRDGLLTLRVHDEGQGGAVTVPGSAGGGSGLAGLAERVRTVDGRLLISSPRGGPTTVTVELPV
ncbi:sensor histidine kinase [Streptomyces sp. bgisy100]|uniref:sensor histidine kinase n=1 Tax=Streptomyces sp. bgisy100 TaxID=3413783 RepID=UPI003D738C76